MTDNPNLDQIVNLRRYGNRLLFIGSFVMGIPLLLKLATLLGVLPVLLRNLFIPFEWLMVSLGGLIAAIGESYRWKARDQIESHLEQQEHLILQGDAIDETHVNMTIKLGKQWIRTDIIRTVGSKSILILASILLLALGWAMDADIVLLSPITDFIRSYKFINSFHLYVLGGMLLIYVVYLSLLYLVQALIWIEAGDLQGEGLRNNIEFWPTIALYPRLAGRGRRLILIYAMIGFIPIITFSLYLATVS